MLQKSCVGSICNRKHDDVIKWSHFPRYWTFVRGIHRSPVYSLHKGQWREALMFSLICALNKRLNKQSCGWWLEMPLWRHCNIKCPIQHSSYEFNALGEFCVGQSILDDLVPRLIACLVFLDITFHTIPQWRPTTNSRHVIALNNTRVI